MKEENIANDKEIINDEDIKKRTYKNLQNYDDLLYEELINLHESTITIGQQVPSIISQVSSLDLQNAIIAYLDILKLQQSGIEEILQNWKIKLDINFNKRCSGIKGIITDTHIENKNIAPIIKDNIIALAFVRITQYELATYSFLAKISNTLEEREAFEFLSKSIKQHEEMYALFIGLIDNDTINIDFETRNIRGTGISDMQI